MTTKTRTQVCEFKLICLELHIQGEREERNFPNMPDHKYNEVCMTGGKNCPMRGFYQKRPYLTQLNLDHIMKSWD